MQNFKKSSLFFLIILLCCQSMAQEKKKDRKKNKVESDKELMQEDYFKKDFLRYDNFIYDTLVRSVQLSRLTDELSPPVMKLNSDDILKLGFDILSLELKSYMYSFIHCDPDWNPTQLSEAEYMNGFFSNYITDYEFSVNTLQRYVHYNVNFPNESVKFTQSGNYLLLVYEENNKEKPILTRRFIIYEEKLFVGGKILRPSIPEYRTVKQKIEFTISHSGQTVTDPNRDIKVAVLQNYRWDNAITDLKPQFIKENELIYTYDEKNLFFGGNEFRNFDIKTLRFNTPQVQRITFESRKNHVYLLEDQLRGRSRYSSQEDINGKFVIRLQEGWDSDTEADYAYVHFTLKYPAPVTDGNIYIFGALSDWGFSDEFKMKYDYEKRSYYGTLFLKQGYYNYKYLFFEDKLKTGSPLLIEGSYLETENDYAILVYFREPNSHFFRLSGFRHLNSRSNF